MKIPLNQFEQYIDEVILKRGLSYFKNGQVSEPEEITQGFFEAIVEGSEDYTVRVSIKKGNIVDYSCNCPYDMGPVCKHIAALIFCLQEDVLEMKDKPSAKNKKVPNRMPGRRKTVMEQVNELLDNVSYEELKKFILEKSEHNPSFRNIFLSSFAHLNNNDSKEFYLKQVKTVLKKAAGRDGYISWDRTWEVNEFITDLLMDVQKHLEKKNFKTVISICCSVMEELVEAFQYADDSHGQIGENIDRAFEILCNLTKEKLPEEIRKSLLNYTLTSFEKGIYHDWDWHLGMLDLASQLFTDEKEAQRIITHIDEIQHSEYEREHAQKIKLEILRKTKGDKEAESFIEANLSNPIFRRGAIEKAIKKKEFEKAIQLARNGIKNDIKEKPGLAKEWYDWLLKIAQKQKDKEKIIEYSRYLFIDNFRNEQDYYQLMKNNVPSEEWTSFVERIIEEIGAKSRWGDTGLSAEIYIREQWWDRLLKFVSKDPSLYQIENYEKYLSKNYTVELIGLYEKCIIDYLRNNTGRSHYKTACRYLRRMMKLGARKKANDLIQILRQEYPQRKALIEELNMV